MKYDVIVVAAGKGSRTGLPYNKMFYKLEDGRTVLETSLSVFEQDPDCANAIIVCALDELEEVKAHFSGPKRIFVQGGATRQDSVRNGLASAVSPFVLIHDGARPFLQKSELAKIKTALETDDAALLMVPAVDTVKRVIDGYVVETLVRSQLMCAQTPQAFKTDLIRACHEKAHECGYVGTDDAQLAEVFSDVQVRAVEGLPSNRKITVAQDVEK